MYLHMQLYGRALHLLALKHSKCKQSLENHKIENYKIPNTQWPGSDMAPLPVTSFGKRYSELTLKTLNEADPISQEVYYLLCSLTAVHTRLKMDSKTFFHIPKCLNFFVGITHVFDFRDKNLLDNPVLWLFPMQNNSPSVVRNVSLNGNPIDLKYIHIHTYTHVHTYLPT
jgi:hypothetical protein